MKTLFRTTIIVLSEYNPDATDLELSELVRDSETGESYCLGSTVEEINCEDLEGKGAKEFFSCGDVDEDYDKKMLSVKELK